MSFVKQVAFNLATVLLCTRNALSLYTRGRLLAGFAQRCMQSVRKQSVSLLVAPLWLKPVFTRLLWLRHML